MAKIKRRTTGDLSAFTADQIFATNYGNRGTLISVANRRKKSKSEKLKATNDRHKEASKWVKMILSDPAMDEFYSKGITKELNNSRLVAIKDFMNAPKIEYVKMENYNGAVGDKIRIKATDYFKVIAVTVTISNAIGKLEEGVAVRDRRKPKMWTYATTVLNAELPGTIVAVKAEDHPGNETLHEVTLASNGDNQVRTAVALCKRGRGRD